MSEPSQEPRGIRARASRWNAARRGRKTLKAAYAQAARDVKRMDPAVRERIGRANMTKSDLQQLANLHVDAQLRPDRYAGVSQRLGQEAGARLAQSGPAPSAPPRNRLLRLATRYSRAQRNERQGTKALKAAFTQAARDVKRTDPTVLRAIGRSTLNQADLASLAAGRMDQVFRPEGRFQGTPGQQQQQGVQSRGAGRQSGAPPQQQQQAPVADQMTQRIADLQQQIAANQQRALTLMEESNRLQAQMQELIQTRVAQIQQEAAGLTAMQGQMADMNVQFNQAIAPQKAPELGQQEPGENQPDARADQTGEQTTEGGEQQPPGAQTGEQPQVGDNGQPQVTGDGQQVTGDGEQVGPGEQQVTEDGQQPVAATDDQQLGGEAKQLGDGQQAPGTGDQLAPGTGDQQAPGTGERQGGQPQAQTADEKAARAAQTPSKGEVWTGVAKNPEAQAEIPSAAKLDGDFATHTALRGVGDAQGSNPEKATQTAESAGEDTGKQQRAGQGTKGKKDLQNKPSGRS